MYVECSGLETKRPFPHDLQGWEEVSLNNQLLHMYLPSLWEKGNYRIQTYHLTPCKFVAKSSQMDSNTLTQGL